MITGWSVDQSGHATLCEYSSSIMQTVFILTKTKKNKNTKENVDAEKEDEQEEKEN